MIIDHQSLFVGRVLLYRTPCLYRFYHSQAAPTTKKHWRWRDYLVHVHYDLLNLRKYVFFQTQALFTFQDH